MLLRNGLEIALILLEKIIFKHMKDISKERSKKDSLIRGRKVV